MNVENSQKVRSPTNLHMMDVALNVSWSGRFFGEMMLGTGDPLGPYVKPRSVKSNSYRSQMP